jgi:hypothetical protein
MRSSTWSSSRTYLPVAPNPMYWSGRRTMPAGQLEVVVRPEQVGLDRVIGAAVDAGQGGGFGRAFQQRVDLTQRQQIIELADVGVLELDAGRPQPGQVQLRAAAP